MGLAGQIRARGRIKQKPAKAGNREEWSNKQSLCGKSEQEGGSD
jgi:hypothetical protein